MWGSTGYCTCICLCCATRDWSWALVRSFRALQLSRSCICMGSAPRQATGGCKRPTRTLDRVATEAGPLAAVGGGPAGTPGSLTEEARLLPRVGCGVLLPAWPTHGLLGPSSIVTWPPSV